MVYLIFSSSQLVESKNQEPFIDVILSIVQVPVLRICFHDWPLIKICSELKIKHTENSRLKFAIVYHIFENESICN